MEPLTSLEKISPEEVDQHITIFSVILNAEYLLIYHPLPIYERTCSREFLDYMCERVKDGNIEIHSITRKPFHRELTSVISTPCAAHTEPLRLPPTLVILMQGTQARRWEWQYARNRVYLCQTTLAV